MSVKKLSALTFCCVLIGLFAEEEPVAPSEESTVAGEEEPAAPEVPPFVYLNDSGVVDLTQTSAWSTSVVPSTNDVAVFDGAPTLTFALGMDTHWAGLVRTNNAANVTFAAPEGGVLTVGAEGMAFQTSTKDASCKSTFDVDVIADGEQTWNLLSISQSPHFHRPVTATDKLNLRGSRTFCFLAGIDATNGLDIAGATVFLGSNTVARGSVDIHDNGTLALVQQKGDYAFSDLFPSGSVVNNGVFSFGAPDYEKNWAYEKTVTLGEGDVLTGPCDAGVSSRSQGMVHVQDTHVVLDGGTIDANTWLYLRTGSYTQKRGSAKFEYAAEIGRGTWGGYGVKKQEMTLEGGSFSARRITVGLGNSDGVPARLLIKGGDLRTHRDWDASWATAMCIGARTANGETGTDGKPLAEATWACGEVLQSGGTNHQVTIRFGGEKGPYDGRKNDESSAARYALSGGTLELGQTGVVEGDQWVTNGMDGSYYEFRLSGGRITPFTRNSQISARARLSDRDGGTEWFTRATDTMTVYTSLFGDGGLRKTGPGTLIFASGNDYTGPTDVLEGQLRMGIGRNENAVWRADDLFGAKNAGDSVAEWLRHASGGSEWTFKTTSFINGANAAPTFAFDPAAFNGHASLHFNGGQSLFLTGNSAQPISDKDAFSMALVLRTEPGYVGTASATDVLKATPIIGAAIDPSAGGNYTSRLYGLSINEQGCIGCGMRIYTGSKASFVVTNEVLWSSTPVNDGRPHVVMWTWKFSGEHILAVDDVTARCASPSNSVMKTYKTRLVIGAGEQSSAKFTGDIADLRFADYQLTVEQRLALSAELGAKYGVEVFASALEAPAETPAAPVELPEPTARFSADSLAQSAGETVEAWQDDGGTWTLGTALPASVWASALKINTPPTAPKIAADTVKGHKLLSFNGTSDVLGVTGNSVTPGSDANGLSVAAVVRFTNAGVGDTTGDWRNTAQFISSTYYYEGMLVNNYGLGINTSGRVSAGRVEAGKDIALTRSRQRFLNDGDLHVVVWTLPKINEENAKMTLTVDGMRTEAAAPMSYNTVRTRFLVGGGEALGRASYAPVDFAEFRMYKNVSFSAAQVEALSRELAATYGVYLRGYDAPGKGTAQKSREVIVHAGASYGGRNADDFTLDRGQTLRGDGSIVGWMHVADGAFVAATPSNNLAIAHAEFEDGGGIKAEFGADGALAPLVVSTRLTLPAGTVKIDLSGSARNEYRGTLLRWTGSLFKRGATTFEPSDPALRNKVAFSMDESAKTLSVRTAGGSVLIVR